MQVREDRSQGCHMDLESANKGQIVIELIAIANIVGTLVLLLWCE
jgi:hypothetical protein